MKILLVEDDYLLNKAITTYFKDRYTIDSFTDGLAAYHALHAGYDVFLVDIDIPQINGIELLEEIRNIYAGTHVIIISATIDIDSIEKAYQYGCNDYLKKPFNIKELEFKLNLLTKKQNKKYSIAQGFYYDSDNCELYYHDAVIKLTPKESKLLYVLLNNRNSVVTLEHIFDAVWENNGLMGDQIRQLVSRLNKKLPLPIIENRTGQGYIIPQSIRN